MGDMAAKFTKTQGQYLAFMAAYTKLNRVAPAEADMQRYFRVSPPSVHQMVLTLEKLGLIARTPGQARSIQVLVPRQGFRSSIDVCRPHTLAFVFNLHARIIVW